MRDAPARQQTLRNTVAWSYDLLSKDEQRLFRLLSIFVGGCTLEALEALWGRMDGMTADVIDDVASLIDKSLLKQVEQLYGEPRLLMLEMLREYGQEQQVACEEREMLRNLHTDSCLGISAALVALGELLARLGQLTDATYLLGAAEALREAPGIRRLPPLDLVFHEQTLANIRAQLGEENYVAAWAAGSSMSLEQIFKLSDQILLTAQRSTQANGEGRRRAKNSTSSSSNELTSRELEVLRLVVSGLTDPQVAECLVISPRTVNSHLRSIYGKLHVTSRSAATRCAIEQHLI